MACQPLPPPPPESPPPAPTTILTIGEDLLLEIFLRLPSLPTLVRAAFACRTFLNTIRSSPTFRPTFHALHPPPLIGLFLTHREGDIPSFAPLRGGADKDHAAVLRGSDFYLTRVPDDQGCWTIRDCRDGYLLLHNERSGIFAAYSPLARALRRIPSPPTEPLRELYILSERHGSFRLVCVHEDGLQVRAVVFSSHSREWQVLPWTDAATINKHHPNDDKQCLPPAPTTGKLVNGRVYWARNDYLILLDTTTLQFSSMDLPPPMDGQKPFVVGETKDEELCMVCAIDHRLTVAIWVRKRADDGDDVEKWMLDREVTLPEIPMFKLAAPSRGFLYLYLMARNDPNIVPLCSVFSFCLEEIPAAELKKIFSLYQYELERSFPYVMPWPSSLACSNKIMNPRIAST
jgi:hypothetical protein